MKPGDMQQVQRFTALLHRSRIAQAQDKMEAARAELSQPARRSAAQLDSLHLPDVPKHVHK